MITEQLIGGKGTSKSTYEKDKTSEKPIRSVAKAISWRLIGTIDTLVVSLFFVQEASVAASIAGVDFVTKMILYFFHERIWNKIGWGK